jgi:PKD repeat protein
MTRKIFFTLGLLALLAFLGVPAVQAVSLTASPVKVVEGSTATTDLVIDEVPTGLSGFNITMTIAHPALAQVTALSYPSWVTVHQDSGINADTLWIKGADLTLQVESGASSVRLGTLTIRGDQTGQTSLDIAVTRLDDDAGTPISCSVVPGQIRVVPLVLALPGQTALPTDPDGDDIYEDMNGNGRIDFNDVVLFFNHMEWIEDSEPVQYFDFNGNTRIDFDDVVDLFWGI